MTLEDEFERVLANDISAIADLLNAIDVNGNSIYRDPLYDLNDHLLENYGNNFEYHKNAIYEFNKNNNSNINPSDISHQLSDDNMDFREFLLVYLGRTNSSGLIAYCKKAFVKAVQTIPNNSIRRCPADRNIEIFNSPFIPVYINKYYSAEGDDNLYSISLNNCTFTHADCRDFPYASSVEFINCQSMESLIIPTQLELGIRGTVFKKLDIIKNTKKNIKDSAIEINVTQTSITSMNDINIYNEKDSMYKIELPRSITTLEKETPFHDDMPITYVFSANSKLNTFYGLRRYDVIRQRIHGANVALTDTIDNEESVKLLFPNLKNPRNKWVTYKSLQKKYKDLLTNKIMEFAYKASDPETVEKFEVYLKRFNGYGADVDNISLLISLLMK